MIKAVQYRDDGRHLYLFGLSELNITRLREGKPIAVQLEQFHGKGTVIIMWGETEEAIKLELEKAGIQLPAVDTETKQ